MMKMLNTVFTYYYKIKNMTFKNNRINTYKIFVLLSNSGTNKMVYLVQIQQ